MGNYLGYESKPKPEPALLTKPWRKTESAWDDKYVKKIIQELKEFVVDETGQEETENEEEKVTRAKCLLLGPTNVGKSTFINSVISICNNRYSNVAYTKSDAIGTTTTTEFKYFGGNNDLGRKLSLCDVPGLFGTKGIGFNVDNIMHLINGNVRYGYRFNASSAISEGDRYFRHKPTLQDKVHCAAFVIGANNLPDLTPSYIEKIQLLQKALNEKGVPRIVLLTKCDLLCREVDEEVENLFRSNKVKKAVEEASVIFSMPVSNIHPIVNYGEREVYLDAATSIPILLAVRQLTHFTCDFIQNEAMRKSQEKELARAGNP